MTCWVASLTFDCKKHLVSLKNSVFEKEVAQIISTVWDSRDLIKLLLHVRVHVRAVNSELIEK